MKETKEEVPELQARELPKFSPTSKAPCSYTTSRDLTHSDSVSHRLARV